MEKELSLKEQNLIAKIQEKLGSVIPQDGGEIAKGVFEMAAGAGIIATGVQNGWIVFGGEFVATSVSAWNDSAINGSLLGGSAGLLAGTILGGIGVAGAGGAIGVPAVVVAGGAAAILGAFGYTATDVLSNIMTPVNSMISVPSVLGSVSILAVGMALIIKGARRIIGTNTAQNILSYIKDGTLELKPVLSEKMLTTQEKLCSYAQAFNQAHQEKFLPAGITLTAGAAGAAITAATIAPPAATILGSAKLGAWGVAAGVVAAPTAPVWTVLAGGAVAGGAGYAGWKYLRNRKSKKCNDEEAKKLAREDIRQLIYVIELPYDPA